jgi:hypothetical protein
VWCKAEKALQTDRRVEGTLKAGNSSSSSFERFSTSLTVTSESWMVNVDILPGLKRLGGESCRACRWARRSIWCFRSGIPVTAYIIGGNS